MTPGISLANFYEHFIDLLHSDLTVRAYDPLLVGPVPLPLLPHLPYVLNLTALSTICHCLKYMGI